MKVYRYTGRPIYWYSGRNQSVRHDLKHGDLLLEGDKRLDVKPDPQTGPEPFEHVDDLPEVDDIKDFNDLLDRAKGIRGFIIRGNYASLNWVKPSIDNLWKISLNQFGCTVEPPPEWYGLKKEQLQIWLNKLIEWVTPKLPSISNDPLEEEADSEDDQPVNPEDVPARFRERGEPDGEILTTTYMLKMKGIWCFPHRTWFHRKYEKGELTERIKVGNTYAYLYCECYALSAKNDEGT